MFCLLLTLTGDGWLHLQQKHVFYGWYSKTLQVKVTCNTRSKSGDRRSSKSPRETPPPSSKGDQPHLPLILERSFLKIVRAIDVGKRDIKFNIDGVRSASSQLRFEVCIMINVNYVLPHHHIGREEPKENEAKEEKMLHSCDALGFQPEFLTLMSRSTALTLVKRRST
jgi:hypothetical protein